MSAATPLPSATTRAKGCLGERLVVRYLQKRKFTVLGTNVVVGRTEIDLIARRHDLLVFCEVRTLSATPLYEPHASLRYDKLARIRRAAEWWADAHGYRDHTLRCDVASVTLAAKGGRVSYIPNAF